MGLNFKGKVLAFFAYVFFLLYMAIIMTAQAQEMNCEEESVKEYDKEGVEINLKDEVERENEVRDEIHEQIKIEEEGL